MKKILVLLGIFIVLLFGSRDSWAQIGDKGVTLGYDLTSGLDGELSYGFTLGAGFEFEDTNEVRIDLMYQKYTGTTWDASKAYWGALGKSIADADASILALMVGVRGYMFVHDLNLDKFRPFFYLGGGYYISQWEDIHPNEGESRSFGIIPGIGFEYMVTHQFGVGMELKRHVLFASNTGPEDLTTGHLNLIYQW